MHIVQVINFSLIFTTLSSIVYTFQITTYICRKIYQQKYNFLLGNHFAKFEPRNLTIFKKYNFPIPTYKIVPCVRGRQVPWLRQGMEKQSFTSSTSSESGLQTHHILRIFDKIFCRFLFSFSFLNLTDLLQNYKNLFSTQYDSYNSNIFIKKKNIKYQDNVIQHCFLFYFLLRIQI